MKDTQWLICWGKKDDALFQNFKHLIVNHFKTELINKSI